MLHVVKNDTAGKGYCGPIAVASITGKRLSKVLDAIRDRRYGGAREMRLQGYTRTPNVRGTSHGELRHALSVLGWSMQEEAIENVRDPSEIREKFIGWVVPRARTLAKPTLAAWLKTRTADQMKVAYILQVSNHWIAVSGRKLCDTYTKGEPVFIRSAPHRRKRVRKAYRVERIA